MFFNNFTFVVDLNFYIPPPVFLFLIFSILFSLCCRTFQASHFFLCLDAKHCSYVITLFKELFFRQDKIFRDELAFFWEKTESLREAFHRVKWLMTWGKGVTFSPDHHSILHFVLSIFEAKLFSNHFFMRISKFKSSPLFDLEFVGRVDVVEDGKILIDGLIAWLKGPKLSSNIIPTHDPFLVVPLHKMDAKVSTIPQRFFACVHKIFDKFYLYFPAIGPMKQSARIQILW